MTTTTQVHASAQAFADASETFAHFLADDNQVEAAWFLRGFTDRMVGRPGDDSAAFRNEYGQHYRAGWNAAGKCPA